MANNPRNRNQKKQQKQEFGPRILTVRFLVMIVWWIILLEICYMPPALFSEWADHLVRLGVWLIGIGATITWFIVSVPEVTGLVAVNLLTGNLKAFGPGLNIKYPWERVRPDNFFSLEIVTKTFEQDYASKDGPMMHVKASYQYRPDPRRLDNFIGVDDTTIEKGFSDVLSSILSGIISKEPCEDVRTKIKEVADEVAQVFRNENHIMVREEQKTYKDYLEEQYGIDFKLFAIADIDFSKDYQEMRSAGARMKKFAVISKELRNDLRTGDQETPISAKDAANLVLVEQGKASKEIFELEGAAGDSLGAMLMAMFRPKKETAKGRGKKEEK